MTTHRPNRPPGFQTRAIHHGYDPQEERGAVVPPIYMTSTYAFPNVAASDAVLAEECEAFLYGREHNPTQDLLERRIAHLEGAEAGVAAASGMAAISSLFLSLMEAGDELIVSVSSYRRLLTLPSGLARHRVVGARVRDGQLQVRFAEPAAATTDLSEGAL